MAARSTRRPPSRLRGSSFRKRRWRCLRLPTRTSRSGGDALSSIVPRLDRWPRAARQVPPDRGCRASSSSSWAKGTTLTLGARLLNTPPCVLGSRRGVPRRDAARRRSARHTPGHFFVSHGPRRTEETEKDDERAIRKTAKGASTLPTMPVVVRWWLLVVATSGVACDAQTNQAAVASGCKPPHSLS